MTLRAKFVMLLVSLAVSVFALGATTEPVQAKAPVAKVAVNGTDAALNARSAVVWNTCGKKSYWWTCFHVSRAVCSGGGGGTWHCWVAFTERHRINIFAYRCRNAYVYVDRLGNTLTPVRHYC